MENQIFIQKKTQLNIWLEYIRDGVAYVCIKYQKRVNQYVSFMFSNIFLNDSGSITFLLQGKTFPIFTWMYVFNWLVSKYFLGKFHCEYCQSNWIWPKNVYFPIYIHFCFENAYSSSGPKFWMNFLYMIHQQHTYTHTTFYHMHGKSVSAKYAFTKFQLSLNT